MFYSPEKIGYNNAVNLQYNSADAVVIMQKYPCVYKIQATAFD